MDQLEMPNAFSRACIEVNEALGAVKAVSFIRMKSFIVPFKKQDAILFYPWERAVRA